MSSAEYIRMCLSRSILRYNRVQLSPSVTSFWIPEIAFSHLAPLHAALHGMLALHTHSQGRAWHLSHFCCNRGFLCSRAGHFSIKRPQLAGRSISLWAVDGCRAFVRRECEVYPSPEKSWLLSETITNQNGFASNHLCLALFNAKKQHFGQLSVKATTA